MQRSLFFIVGGGEDENISIFMVEGGADEKILTFDDWGKKEEV